MVVAPEELNPTTVAAVVESVLTMLLLILTTVAGEAEIKPVTVPPVPLEVKLVMVFPLMARDVAAPELPMFIPVIIPCPVILVIVFDEAVDAPPKKFKFIPVTAFVPPVQLLNVLLLIFLVGAPPSVFDQPAIVVAPVAVILENYYWYGSSPHLPQSLHLKQTN